MTILPPSRGRILFGLGVAYLLVQYIYVSYYNEPRRFDNIISTTTQEELPSSNPGPTGHLNVSGIQGMIDNDIHTKNTDNNQFLSLCPQTPPDLNGTIRLLVPAQVTLEEVAQQLSWLRLLEGGHQAPLVCQARYKIAIIVPYRDRLSNLCTFLLNMHPFLTKQQLDYTIFIVEQFDDGLFNRAMLMNVGFKEALKLRNFDCFFFHDVDLIPENDKNIYSCPEQPRHMSVAIDKFNYRLPYVDLFGGVIGMSRNHFQLVNGFSNMFWGWGGEDDDMASRVKAHDLNITRYQPNVARYHMLTHTQQKANPKRMSPVIPYTTTYHQMDSFELPRANPDRTRYEKLYSGRRRFKTDGLNNLEYQVKSLKQLPLFTYLLVDLTGRRS